MNARQLRLAGLAGIVFAVVIVVCNFLPGSMPALDDSAGEIRDFWVDKRDALLVGAAIQALVAPLFFWFLAGIRDVVRRADGDASPFALVAVVGGVILAAVVFVGTALGAAVFYNEDVLAKTSDEVVLAVWNASNLTFIMTGLFVALLAGGFGLAVLWRATTMPPWLGWVSVVVAAIGLLSTVVGVTSPDAGAVSFGGFFAFMIWVILAGIVMTQRAGAEPRV